MVPLVSHLTLPGFLTKYLMVGDEAPLELVQSVRDAVSWVTPKVLAGRVREALHVDVRGELAQVKVPILYLQPTGDRLIHSLCVEEMRLVKPGRMVEIVGPHLLLQAEPALCAEAVVEFLSELAIER
jgi:pimeloyl-ACP methyl ester carboxylesterase